MNFLFAIALLIASYIIQRLVTPGPKATPASTLKDFQVPQVNEGTPQPVIFGDCWTGDWTVLWYGDLKVRALSGGGKK